MNDHLLHPDLSCPNNISEWGDVLSKFRYFGSIVFGIGLFDDFSRLGCTIKYVRGVADFLVISGYGY